MSGPEFGILRINFIVSLRNCTNFILRRILIGGPAGDEEREERGGLIMYRFQGKR